MLGKPFLMPCWEFHSPNAWMGVLGITFHRRAPSVRLQEIETPTSRGCRPSLPNSSPSLSLITKFPASSLDYRLTKQMPSALIVPDKLVGKRSIKIECNQQCNDEEHQVRDMVNSFIFQ
uniref:Uncharacterized protein n=1 Tax=Cucumis melo TaxID=3656 RepID=A0A9I9EIP5_CUCME